MENMVAAATAAEQDPAATAPVAGTETMAVAAETGTAAAATLGTAPAADAGKAPAAAADKAGQEADPPADGGENTEPNQEEKLKEWERSLQEKEAALQQKEIEAVARDLLKEKGIPETMLPYVQRESREKTVEYIEKFNEAFAGALEEKYNAGLKGRTPASSTGVVTDGDKTDADIFAAALRG